MDTILTLATIILYAAATVLLVRRMAKGAAATTRSKYLPIGAALLGVVLHGLILHGDILVAGGLNLTFFNMLSLIGWLVALIVMLSALRQPIENLGIAALPLAALAVLLHHVVPVETVAPTAISAGVKTHVLLSIFSYSLLSIAAAQAVLLAVQDKHLRNRHPGGYIRALPPLQTMETLLFRMIGLGYLLLSLALVTGAMFLENIYAQHLVHKTVLSIVAWVVFAVLLYGRWKFGWRGRTAIRWTISGFVVLMLAYFGSKLVLELILQR